MKEIAKKDNNIKESKHKADEKTQNQADEKKPVDSKKSLLVILIIIAAIIIMIIASYFIVNSVKNIDKNKVVYNNYQFQRQQDGYWYTVLYIQNTPYQIPFYNNPLEVENIPVTNDTFVLFKNFFESHPGGKVYVTLNPDESSKMVIAAVEVGRILGNKYNMFNLDVSPAFSQESATRNINETGYPLITCDNASSNVLVIWMTVADRSEVYSDKGCIIVKSENINDSIRVADALTYRLLTITKNT